MRSWHKTSTYNQQFARFLCNPVLVIGCHVRLLLQQAEVARNQIHTAVERLWANALTAPGPSGWRDARVLAIAYLPTSSDTLRAWANRLCA